MVSLTSTFVTLAVALATAHAQSPGDCPLADQTKPPGDLTQCGNQTLFYTWRPKARFIAPEGWMNDPMGMVQFPDGSFHAGYQYHPQHIQWGNISQGAAFSKDLVYWEDANSWQDPKTLSPSQIYDIRGVFDGTIIKDGWGGYPTIIYTSTFPGPLGATSNPPEQPGAETQSLAYTKDGGRSWIKLNFGAGGNPIIYAWPENNLTGFRDPYAFTSPKLSSLLGNNSANATGDHFLTISGGLRTGTGVDDYLGSRLYLYRQTEKGNVVDWTYLGPLLSTGRNESWSDWSGNFGKNYETAWVSRLTTTGRSDDAGEDSDAVDVIGFGTELGRTGSHENHWPLWAAVSYSAASNGTVTANIAYAGVADWGRTYAFVTFPVSKGRDVMIGWTYEDDENLVLAKQQGYQGAFTLFRDLYVKHIKNVSPDAPGLNEKGSWSVRTEADNSTTVVTIGQKVIPEINTAYKKNSKVSTPRARTLSPGYTAFETQPSGKHYTLTANFQFKGPSGNLPTAGFRVLASEYEYTDIVYDPNQESLFVYRNMSSLVKSYGNDTEVGKLRLWPILNSNGTSTRETLTLTVYVDASIVEVYANDVTVITTRVYPWLTNSTGVGFLTTQGDSQTSVYASQAQLWDGLINAWPKRPADTRRGLVWDGPTPSIWGVWTGI